MKVHGVLYILTYKYNYKVITGCDTILQEYYITDRRKCENTKRYTIINSTEGTHKLRKGNSRGEQGLEDRATDGQLLTQDATAAPL